MVKTVFMGSDAIALPFLAHLRENYKQQFDLIGVFTQPDRPSGRGMKLQPNAIKTWAQKENLPVRQPVKVGDDDLAWLHENKVDLILVMAYGQILSQKLLDIPTIDTLNFHASILPRYRGASPIQTAIAEGELETGVSLMRVVKKLDAGPVFDIERVSILRDETPATLFAKLGEACLPLVDRSLIKIAKGELEPTPQDESKVTFTRLIYKTDADLDFYQPAQKLEQHIRAFQPWPGPGFDWENIRIKIGKAIVLPSTEKAKPGTILGTVNKRLHIATGDGILAVETLQRPGGKMLPTEDFLRGLPLPAGAVIASREMEPLVGEKPFKRKVKTSV